MTDIQHKQAEYTNNSNHFLDSSKVSEANKEAVKQFCDKLLARGRSKGRISKYYSMWHTILQLTDDPPELMEADESDLERLVAAINQSDDHSEATKNDMRVTVKFFYKVMEGDGDSYPDKVDFISTTLDKTKVDDPDPLSRDEIDAIIQACKNDRDRAMYKVLYEGGLRAGELMSLQIKDVSFTDAGVKVSVDGKTGNRTVLLVESERYLRNWLSKHPHSDDREAPLWVKVDGNNISSGSYEDIKIEYDYMRVNLKRKAVAADVRVKTTEEGNETSDVYPHLFRHSRATHLATEMTEAAMKEYFGWTQGSDMPATYIHLSGRDIDSEIKSIYGIQDEDDEPEQRECPRCFKSYKGKDNFCPRCGAPLNGEAQSQAHEVKEVAKELSEAIVSGDISREQLQEIAGEIGS